MTDSLGDHPIFKDWSGATRSWGPEGQFSITLGGDVLSSATDEMERFLASDHWRSERRTPTVIGCSPWLTDSTLTDVLLKFWQSCIVMNKPRPGESVSWHARRLHDKGTGLSLDQFPHFKWLAPHDADGQPMIVGPSTDTSLARFRSVRAAGVSGAGRKALVHAKLLVIGTTLESDDHPSGYAIDFSVFQPHKVWLSSANLTANSRNGLEFGTWSDDEDLKRHVTEFLVDLLSYSEPFGSTSPDAEPELVPFEFDEEAMWEAYLASDRGPGPEDDD